MSGRSVEGMSEHLTQISCLDPEVLQKLVDLSSFNANLRPSAGAR